MTLKAKPPKPIADDRDDRIAAIISSATAASPAPSSAPTQQPLPPPAISAPWKDTQPRKDPLVQLNIRIPHSLSLKLKHISNVTDRPKQDIVAEALASLLDTELLKIGFTEEDL